MKRIDYDFSTLDNIFARPGPLNRFAREGMAQVKYLFQAREEYNCPSSCYSCCTGSIIMSYTEFTYITLYLQDNWPEQEIKEFMRRRMGWLQEDHSKLLCPFLNENIPSRHCQIYPARPLICRVFGTTAAPCEEVEPVFLEEENFNQAYTILYYGGGYNFIALQLNTRWALFKAPFELWCLADGGEESKSFLCDMLERQKDSFRAVLYDIQESCFFTFLNGSKKKVEGKN